MDDCNIKDVSVKLDKINVQIPLWTIVTLWYAERKNRICVVQIPLWTIVTTTASGPMATMSRVQIPLWTIVTRISGYLQQNRELFRFLYGRL